MNKKFLIFLILLTQIWTSANAIVTDDFVDSTLSQETIEKPPTNLDYNYNSTDVVPIKLCVTDKIRSEKDLYEGQMVNFYVAETALYNATVIAKRGTIVPAKVCIIITNGLNGIPASVIFEDFNIPGLDKNKLSPYYEKFGLDLSLLVFPLKWALTILPPTGSLTNFIKGGHVVLRPGKKIIINYYPAQT